MTQKEKMLLFSELIEKAKTSSDPKRLYNEFSKWFRDTENGTIYTEKELYNSYLRLYENGETEAENFKDYISNCTDKNGFLERIER